GQAFTYSGVELAKAACIESQYNLYIGMTADNTVFVHPLWAYRYAGNSFTKVAESTQGPGGGRAIAVAADGTIFFAHGDGLLSAYFYDGASVTYKGSSYSHPNGTGRDVALGIDGTVFLANGTDGLRAYHYHADWFQKFDEIGHINDGGAVIGLSVAHDGTVFVAADDGLRAYSWKDSVFTKIAHQDDGVSGEDIAIAPDGTVYLAAGEHGLIAYAFSKTTTIVAEDSPVPNDFALSQNYPNPFNPSTTIKFSLPKASFVTLKIYNMLGVEVATLVEGRKPAGRHAITFKATNLASGLHYYTLTAGEYRQSRKMLLLR
ncbi:MAG: T9SS C-terminal target domain-containing protein, partial [Calditrichaeota bacterium]